MIREPSSYGQKVRHTAASIWLSMGADIVAVAAWLGDPVETVHRTYAHLMPDADDRGRTAMDRSSTESDTREVPWMCPQTVPSDADTQVRGTP
jgi:hypothetical protein